MNSIVDKSILDILLTEMYLFCADASSSERIGDKEAATQRQLTDDGSEDSDDDYQDTSPYL